MLNNAAMAALNNTKYNIETQMRDNKAELSAVVEQAQRIGVNNTRAISVLEASHDSLEADLQHTINSMMSSSHSRGGGGSGSGGGFGGVSPVRSSGSAPVHEAQRPRAWDTPPEEYLDVPQTPLTPAQPPPPLEAASGESEIAASIRSRSQSPVVVSASAVQPDPTALRGMAARMGQLRSHARGRAGYM